MNDHFVKKENAKNQTTKKKTKTKKRIKVVACGSVGFRVQLTY